VTEAIQLLEPVVSRDEQRPGNLNAAVIGRRVRLGQAYLRAGRPTDARRVFKNAADLAVKLHEDGQVEAATVELARLAAAYQQWRMLEDAVSTHERLLSWDRGPPGGPKMQRIRRAVQLGGLYINVGRPQDAKRVLADAVRWSEAEHGEGALELFAPLLVLSKAHEKIGDLQAAERFCEQALQIAEANLKRGSPHTGLAMRAVGRVQTLQKNLDMAKFALEEAWAILEKHQETDPASFVMVMQDLAGLHQAAGRRSDATRLLREALDRCRGITPRQRSVHVDALLARSIKMLSDALQAQGPATRKEREALGAELKTLLDELAAARALDADNRRWLEELDTSRTGG
jgi:tetratricopeptide (TPR) repeat protein